MIDLIKDIKLPESNIKFGDMAQKIVNLEI